jgi:hypothetical protein
VAKVVPVASINPTRVDWAQSAAFSSVPWAATLTEAESKAILSDSQGD